MRGNENGPGILLGLASDFFFSLIVRREAAGALDITSVALTFDAFHLGGSRSLGGDAWNGLMIKRLQALQQTLAGGL